MSNELLPNISFIGNVVFIESLKRLLSKSDFKEFKIQKFMIGIINSPMKISIEGNNIHYVFLFIWPAPRDSKLVLELPERFISLDIKLNGGVGVKMMKEGILRDFKLVKYAFTFRQESLVKHFNIRILATNFENNSVSIRLNDKNDRVYILSSIRIGSDPASNRKEEYVQILKQHFSIIDRTETQEKMEIPDITSYAELIAEVLYLSKTGQNKAVQDLCREKFYDLERLGGLRKNNGALKPNLDVLAEIEKKHRIIQFLIAQKRRRDSSYELYGG